ncbi:MAG: hypothetical protein QF752_04995 [Planctomycetota bacterium]|jgi:hypothetical protein|nr:hypothetical protein [Planctomycetota bacterium]
MIYQVDPELLFLKWAYRKGFLDDEKLCEFNQRAFGDDSVESYLDQLVIWKYLTREQIEHLLDTETIAEGVQNGVIDEALAASLRLLTE